MAENPGNRENPLNPLAVELNDAIRAANPHVHEMLSSRGRALYFPKGILSQSAEARTKANRINATIGMATEEGRAMALGCVMDQIPGIPADAAVRYAPPAGNPELRAAWREKQDAENPSQRGKPMSLPIVTNALTHGLSLVGDLFVDPGDTLLLPDKLWGNYRLIFGVRLGAKVVTWPFFDDRMRLNVDAFRAGLRESAPSGGKILTILNFPNNPIGYTPSPAEAEAFRDAIVASAEGGANVVAILDDAYFGLCYDDTALRESVFGLLAGCHPRVMAIRLDGATKEMFAWGLRVGFLTFSAGGVESGSPLFEALERKTAGAVRGAISNGPRLSQHLVLQALRSPGFTAQRQQKYELLKARADRIREVLADPSFNAVWEPYPYNSGYFMCVRLKGVAAEAVRVRLLDKYGIGVIAIGDRDLRIAYSCVEVEDIPGLLGAMREAVLDLQREAAR